ncbi:hypothetical protein [Demequina mangrovi]|uniref:Uncharacterized protein n=1 Tax=Demequina mangrovi TaxID=1043493 RepID=A0A1H7ARG6_9MICO|nr:hypothetical protein [Demequina mangrovi]SEJ68203.1 hypothetical protein SAMN05421637_2667 [Demequina mangrovi]
MRASVKVAVVAAAAGLLAWPWINAGLHERAHGQVLDALVIPDDWTLTSELSRNAWSCLDPFGGFSGIPCDYTRRAYDVDVLPADPADLELIAGAEWDMHERAVWDDAVPRRCDGEGEETRSGQVMCVAHTVIRGLDVTVRLRADAAVNGYVTSGEATLHVGGGP